MLTIAIVSSELKELLLSGRFHFPSILIDRVMSLVDMGTVIEFSAGYTDENVSPIKELYLIVNTGAKNGKISIILLSLLLFIVLY